MSTACILQDENVLLPAHTAGRYDHNEREGGEGTNGVVQAYGRVAGA